MPLPSILSVSPAEGPADLPNRLLVAGTGLADGASVPRVYVGPVELVAVSSDGATVGGTLPADSLPPGAWDVRVVTAVVDARLAGAFTLTAPSRMAPEVLLLTPVDGSDVEPGATVTVRAHARSPVACLASVAFVASGAASYDDLRDVMPRAATLDASWSFDVPTSAAEGSVVTVQAAATDDSADHREGRSAPLVLHVTTHPGPRIDAVLPQTGPARGGARVEIQGAYFLADAQVLFDGVPAAKAIVVSPERIDVTTPPHADGHAQVVVRTGNGTASSNYYYVGPPVILAIGPTHGPEIGGTAVTVSGDRFYDVTAVRFGDRAAPTFTVDGPNQLRTVTPPGMGLADLTLESGNGSGKLAAAWQYSPTGFVSFSSVSAAVLPADGVATADLVVRVTDVIGDGVSGEPVTLIASSGTVSPLVDRGDGTYSATFVAPNNVGSGSVRLIAADPNATIKASDLASIALRGGAPAMIDFTQVAPVPLVADGAATALATLAVRDANGNLTSGQLVVVTATGGASVAPVIDLGDGTYHATITAPPSLPKGSTILLTATAGSAAATAVVPLVCGPTVVSIEDAAGGSGRAIAVPTLVAGTSVNLFAVARDRGGAFCGDVSATWAVAGGIGSAAPGPATTTTFTATTTGTGSIGAAAGGSSPGTWGPIAVTPGPLHHFVTGSYVSVRLGDPNPLILLAIDGWGNVQTSFVGKVAIVDSTNAVTPTVSPPFVAGQATVSLTFGLPMVGDQVRVSGGGATGTSAPFDVVAGYQVTGIMPSSGQLAGGTPVNVSGVGFANGDVATIGGQPLVLASVINGNTITGLVPPGAAAGPVDVAVVRYNYPLTLKGAFTYKAISTVTMPAVPNGTWADTTLRSTPGETDSNYGREATIGVGSLDAQLTPGRDRALVSFDLASSLPPGSRVIDARLRLYATNEGWSRFVPLTVTNGTATAWQPGTPVSATFDHAAAVAAGYSMASGDDVHLFYRANGQWIELERAADVGASWNQPKTRLWFQLAAVLSSGASDSGYFIGYGAASAAPHTTSSLAFPPARDSQTVALYACEERAGNSLADSSLNAYTATLRSFASGPFGAGYLSGGLALDGSGYGVSPAPLPRGDFTLEAWFRTTDATAGIAGFVATPPAGGAHPISITLQNGKLAAEASLFTGLFVGTTFKTYNDGAWHHVALTLNTGTLYLFVDGQVAIQGPGLGLPVQVPVGGLVIGAGGGLPPMSGAIDGVRLRNAGLLNFPWARNVGTGATAPEQPNLSTRAIGVFRMLQSWKENNGAPSQGKPANGPANWTLRAGGQPWNGPGASAMSDLAGDGGPVDRAQTPLAVTQVALPEAWYSFDITPIATHWVDGSWAPNGFMLANLSEAGDFSRVAFASVDHPDPARRPTLTVRYAPAGNQGTVTVTVPLSAATSIAAANPNQPNPPPHSVTVSSSGQPGSESRGLVGGTLAGFVPQNKVIVAAQLTLYRTADPWGAPSFVSSRMLLRPFDPAAATWNTAGPGPWLMPGGGGDGSDRVAAPESTVYVAPNVLGAVSWNVAVAAQAWLDQPQFNFGLLLSETSEDVAGGSVFSGAAAANPPVLTVTYLP